MIYSWIAYEKALQELPQYIPSGHREYEKLCSLQSSLIENITQTRLQGDTPELYNERKCFIVELNSLMKCTTRTSFIELCVPISPVLGYLTHVYQTAQDACDIFNSRCVWPIQCKTIVKRFGERPVRDSIVVGISANARSRVYYIDNSINSLIQLMEDFERRCPRFVRKQTKGLQYKQAEILRKLNFFVMEVQTVDCTSFEELVCIWQEIIRSTSSAQLSPSINPRSQPFLQRDYALTPFPANNVTQNDSSLPNIEASVIEAETQHQGSNHKPGDKDEGEHSEINATVTQSATADILGKGNPKLPGEHTGRELHNKLVTLLLKVPDIGKFETRTDLLRNTPSLSLSREPTNPYTDISGLVSQLAEMRLRDGQWALLVLIENAVSRIEGFEIGEELKELRNQFEVSFQQAKQD